MRRYHLTPLQDKQERYTWFSEAIARLRTETDEALFSGVSVPEVPGGWWHQYVCPDHGTELLFDPREADAHSFTCPHGCVVRGEAYREAWLVFKHQERARTALSAAAMYAATREERYAESANAILEAYACQYPRYPMHPNAQPWMLKGRAFHQALTEAIWATTLLRAVLLLNDHGALRANAKLLEQFLGMLERSMAEYRTILIHKRNEPANNYTAWLNACLACVYAVQQRADQMELLLYDYGGIVHHLSIGVLPDQFEFEGSTYYHLFVLRAYWIAAEMAERFGFDPEEWRGEQGQTYRGMLKAIVDVAAPNGELPALHDGPYSRLPFAREIAEVFEIGYARYADEQYVPILQETYRKISGTRARSGLEAVLYGEGEWTERSANACRSRLFDSVGFVVLRHPDNPLSIVADYGPHGGSHGHDDKLNIVLMHRNGFVLPERGMVPYASPMRKNWYARTPSHNTVSVGGRTQAPHHGECVAYIEAKSHTYAWLRSEGAYEGAVLNRHLWIEGNFALDWFEVQLNRIDVIDYWLHILHSPETDPALWTECGNREITGEDEAYGYIHTLMKYKGGEAVAVTSSPGNDSLQAKAVMLPSAGGVIYRIASPGLSVDPYVPIDGFVQRVIGQEACFITAFAVGDVPLDIKLADDKLAVITYCQRKLKIRMTEKGLRQEEELD